MTNIEIQIADRIAGLRKSRGMKLTELAARSHLSPSQISRIEHHMVSPPLPTLAKIAKALEVRVIDFFKDEEASLSLLVHTSSEECSIVLQGGKTYKLPFGSNIYRLMEPVLFQIPRGLKKGHRMTHEGEEYMFILDGTINFCYGKDVHTLHRQEGIYFKSHVPHCSFNESDEDALVLGVMTSRHNLYNGTMFSRFLLDETDTENSKQ